MIESDPERRKEVARTDPALLQPNIQWLLCCAGALLIGLIAISQSDLVLPRDQAGNDPGNLDQLTRIELNTASEAELMLIPGIGKQTAREILKQRSRAGRFRTIADVIKVDGIGEKTLATIQEFGFIRSDSDAKQMAKD